MSYHDVAASSASDEFVSPDGYVGHWAGRIRPLLNRAATSIIAAGTELLSARAAAPHGQWGPLCAELGLTPRTAHRFMAIASNPALANRTHESDSLPPAWTSLYELSKVDPDQLTAAIDDGVVTVETGRGQAQQLARKGYFRQPEPWKASVPAPESKQARYVYEDGHGIVYDGVDDEQFFIDEGWDRQDTPAGPVYVLRRGPIDCGATSCPICSNRAWPHARIPTRRRPAMTTHRLSSRREAVEGVDVCPRCGSPFADPDDDAACVACLSCTDCCDHDDEALW